LSRAAAVSSVPLPNWYRPAGDWSAVANIVIQEVLPGLEHIEGLVLLAIHSKTVGDKEHGRPERARLSHSDLAKMVGATPNGVSLAIKSLEVNKLIEPTQPEGRGRGATKAYRLAVENWTRWVQDPDVRVSRAAVSNKPRKASKNAVPVAPEPDPEPIVTITKAGEETTLPISEACDNHQCPIRCGHFGTPQETPTQLGDKKAKTVDTKEFKVPAISVFPSDQPAAPVALPAPVHSITVKNTSGYAFQLEPAGKDGVLSLTLADPAPPPGSIPPLKQYEAAAFNLVSDLLSPKLREMPPPDLISSQAARLHKAGFPLSEFAQSLASHLPRFRSYPFLSVVVDNCVRIASRVRPVSSAPLNGMQAEERATVRTLDQAALDKAIEERLKHLDPAERKRRLEAASRELKQQFSVAAMWPKEKLYAEAEGLLRKQVAAEVTL